MLIVVEEAYRRDVVINCWPVTHYGHLMKTDTHQRVSSIGMRRMKHTEYHSVN